MQLNEKMKKMNSFNAKVDYGYSPTPVNSFDSAYNSGSASSLRISLAQSPLIWKRNDCYRLKVVCRYSTRGDNNAAEFSRFSCDR